jgi:hypothetical protein
VLWGMGESLKYKLIDITKNDLKKIQKLITVKEINQNTNFTKYI